MMEFRQELAIIRLIAERASMLYKKYGRDVAPPFIENELRIVHFDVCKLRLEEFLNADIDHFAHDITGIHEHLDMLDASFRNGFNPRFKQ